MLTPSSITADSFRSSWILVLVLVQCRQVLHDAAAEYAPLLEIMVEHAAHQSLRLGRDLRIGRALGGERDQGLPAHERPAAGGRGARFPPPALQTAIEGVMVAF